MQKILNVSRGYVDDCRAEAAVRMAMGNNIKGFYTDPSDYDATEIGSALNLNASNIADHFRCYGKNQISRELKIAFSKYNEVSPKKALDKYDMLDFIEWGILTCNDGLINMAKRYVKEMLNGKNMERVLPSLKSVDKNAVSIGEGRIASRIGADTVNLVCVRVTKSMKGSEFWFVKDPDGSKPEKFKVGVGNCGKLKDDGMCKFVGNIIGVAYKNLREKCYNWEKGDLGRYIRHSSDILGVEYSST